MVKAATNVLAVATLQTITKIKEKAKQEMEGQVEKLKEARAAIRERIEELEEQEAELDKVIGEIRGRPTATARGTRATPAETAELRKRMMNWLTVHKGEKFTGADLKKNFPELGPRSPSVVLAPEIEAGTIKREGQRSTMTYQG
jgi:predicted nuclease with TOPRIM domain